MGICMEEVLFSHLNFTLTKVEILFITDYRIGLKLNIRPAQSRTHCSLKWAAVYVPTLANRYQTLRKGVRFTIWHRGFLCRSFGNLGLGNS